jgi:hypothetical protein
MQCEKYVFCAKFCGRCGNFCVENNNFASLMQRTTFILSTAQSQKPSKDNCSALPRPLLQSYLPLIHQLKTLHEMKVLLKTLL